MDSISLSSLLSQISIALDAVEASLLGAQTYHSKRVALLCIAIGKHLSYDDSLVLSLAGCALMHDNALTEYILSEQPAPNQKLNLKSHCILGQENCRSIPFSTQIDGFILYHHECADGSGPFGKKEGEFPEEAGIIALADQIDVLFSLTEVSEAKLETIRSYLLEQSSKKYLPHVVQAALTVLDVNLLRHLANDCVSECLADHLPAMMVPVSDIQLISLSSIIAKIIDYKSEFTKEHSTQIANKAWYMAHYYQFSPVLCAQLYLAAALHDIGKLFTPSEILEKPGRLTDPEFALIQSHVSHTFHLLRVIKGLEQICLWASNHHEKLDGSGYPFGKTGEDLDFNSRLLACLDVYQAVREARPYHPARSHEETILILASMVQKGQLDKTIFHDLDIVLRKLKDGYAPPPAILI